MLTRCKQKESAMQILRTPTHCFDNLPGYSFQENYIDVSSACSFTTGTELRMHYVDYGLANSPVILMLHGEPSWSYLYRHMINNVAQAGFRVIAPDLIGFGKSDKFAEQDAYTYANHLSWLREFLISISLSDIHLICQDWGGLLGLRLVAEQPELFSGVIAANTMLPTGDHKPPQAFLDWQKYSQETDNFDIGNIIQRATQNDLIDEVVAAYNAPYPEEQYKAGARKFPLLVPVRPDDPESENNRQAWACLKQFNKPFITAFSDHDPVTAGGDKIFHKLIPGCKGQAHTTMVNGGHFLQEDCATALAELAITCFKEK